MNGIKLVILLNLRPKIKQLLLIKFLGLIDTSILKVDNKNNLNHTPLLTKELTEEPSIQEPRAEPVKEEHPKEEEREQGPKKIVQKNKGRCFSCRLKVNWLIYNPAFFILNLIIIIIDPTC